MTRSIDVSATVDPKIVLLVVNSPYSKHLEGRMGDSEPI